MNPLPDWFNKKWFNKFGTVDAEKIPEALREFNKIKNKFVNSVMNKKKKHRRDPARPW